MQSLEVDIFKTFRNDWALLTAGSLANFNTMTVSWGGLGTLWNKSVATVYVRPCRHTFGYMENNEYFTISFYPEDYKKDLAVLGKLSGRDGDKVAKTSLTPIAAENSITFSQAKLTLVCKKLYAQDLDPSAIPQDIMEASYAVEPVHKMYIGEVVQILTED